MDLNAVCWRTTGPVAFTVVLPAPHRTGSVMDLMCLGGAATSEAAAPVQNHPRCCILHLHYAGSRRIVTTEPAGPHKF